MIRKQLSQLRALSDWQLGVESSFVYFSNAECVTGLSFTRESDTLRSTDTEFKVPRNSLTSRDFTRQVHVTSQSRVKS